MNYLFFDTETTGMINWRGDIDAPHQPRIVQLAAILTGPCGNVLQEMNRIIKPDGWTISDDAAEIHGIYQPMAEKGGIPLADALDEFDLMADQAERVVCHNTDFDMRMYWRECLVLKRPMATDGRSVFCTMKATTDIVKIPGRYGRWKWPKLQEAYVHFFGKEFDGAHDALVDVRACRDVYFALMKREFSAC